MAMPACAGRKAGSEPVERPRNEPICGVCLAVGTVNMTRWLPSAAVALVVLTQPLRTTAAAKTEKDERTKLSKEARILFLRAAQVWTPTKVGAADLRQGPDRQGSFDPDQHVDCEYT